MALDHFMETGDLQLPIDLNRPVPTSFELEERRLAERPSQHRREQSQRWVAVRSLGLAVASL